MTPTGTLHPQIGTESRTRWILTGKTYRARFTLASLGWIPRPGFWYIDGIKPGDYALVFAKSIRGTRIAKRYVAVEQPGLGM